MGERPESAETTSEAGDKPVWAAQYTIRKHEKLKPRAFWAEGLQGAYMSWRTQENGTTGKKNLNFYKYDENDTLSTPEANSMKTMLKKHEKPYAKEHQKTITKNW